MDIQEKETKLNRRSTTHQEALKYTILTLYKSKDVKLILLHGPHTLAISGLDK